MPTYIKIMLLTILILVTAVNAHAQPLNPKALDRVIDQLGADEFKQREAAEKSLAEHAREEPEATRTALKKRLLSESDPEIQFRINRILRIISRRVPTEKVPFTKEALAADRWQILGDMPDKARYEFEEELLEIHSLDRIEEGMAFVHRFRQRGAVGEKLRFGPRPEPDPERFVIDAEIKILKEHHNRNGLAGMHLNVEDHRASAGLMILEDGVFLYRHKQVHRMDTTDRFHHFRFVIDGNFQWVFVDDMEQPVFKLERPTQAGRRWATFGDGTAGAGVHAQIRNVTFARHECDTKRR